jgi:hypothetical protein
MDVRRDVDSPLPSPLRSSTSDPLREGALETDLEVVDKLLSLVRLSRLLRSDDVDTFFSFFSLEANMSSTLCPDEDWCLSLEVSMASILCPDEE